MSPSIGSMSCPVCDQPIRLVFRSTLSVEGGVSIEGMSITFVRSDVVRHHAGCFGGGPKGGLRAAA